MAKRVLVLIGVSVCVLVIPFVRAQDSTNRYGSSRSFLMDDFSGSACDTGDDGIPGAWRLQYFGTTNIDSTTCASCDPDGDGYSNLQEYNFESDPTNSAS